MSPFPSGRPGALRRLAAGLALAGTAAAAAGAQAAARTGTIALHDALRRADSAAFGNRAATAQRAGQDAQALLPLKGILPALHVDAGWMQTTDPVAVFGTRMRQRLLSAADFNPAILNNPGAATNLSGGVGAEVPLLNVDAWAARRAATTGADAARAAEQWARLATRADVVRAYFGTLLADERTRTLAAALASARAHVEQAASMHRNGVVTASDALLANVRAGDVEAQLLEATAGARSARQSLGLVLGERDGARLAPAGTLPTPDALRALAREDSALAPVTRADETAALLAADAATADGRRATAGALPRVNGFARYDWNDRATPFAGQPAWTVGVMASWSLLTGGATMADRRAAESRATAARAMADGAAARARLERDDSEQALRVALDRLALAERSATQGAEAHRIVEKRYAGGIATVSELLDAQAAETATALGLAKARYDLVAALAARRLAAGRDPGALERLDSTTPPPSPTKEHD